MSEFAEKTGKIGAAAVLAFELMGAGNVEAAERGKVSNLDTIEQAAKAENPEADPSTGAQIIEAGKVVGVRYLEQVKQGGEDYYEDIVVAIGDKVEGRMKFVDSRTGAELSALPAGLDQIAAEWKAIEAAKRALELEGQHPDAVTKLTATEGKLAKQMQDAKTPSAYAAR